MTRHAKEQSLWDFSVGLYGHEPVKASALALQDAGLDVNTAFWIVWSTGRGRDPLAVLDAAMALTGQWHAIAVGPLRAVRDALKTPAAEVPPDAATALRRTVLDAELAAEKIAQTMLAKLEPPASPGTPVWPDTALLALEHYAVKAGVTAPVTLFKEAIFSALEKE